MNSLQTQIHFTLSLKNKILIGFILSVYLSFIVIVLRPFDTSQFKAEYKTLLLAGYGVFTFVVFVIHSWLENFWYKQVRKIWTVRHEMISTLFFCFFVGTVLYMYNRTVVNNFRPYTLVTYWRFLSVTVLYMLPVFIPPMVYLRQKFGEKMVPLPPNSFVLVGENKNEVLQLEKGELLFVKAVENYVEICFMDPGKKVISKTFRQTLSNICYQLPFLEKCHRSYLVNMITVKEISGNSQGAKISFLVGEKEIPLSKTYYKQIKNSLA